MKDEEYVFYQDIKQKKSAGRCAFNAGRSHRGAVRLPSDNLTRKEKEAMNGEVQAYRINEPMGWKEFKSMPDDIKVLYIRALRDKYYVPDSHIAGMLGRAQQTFAKEIKRLGLSNGKGTEKKRWDKSGWEAFAHGVPAPKMPEVDTPAPLAFGSSNPPLLPDTKTEVETAIPCSGSMTFYGSVVAALQTVTNIIGESRAKITVIWECEADGQEGI